MSHKYLLGLYDDEVPLLNAVKKIREAGYVIHDVLTPFPVHGLDDAMGIKETRLHTAGFIYGAIGTSIALFGMSWVTNIAWPVNIGGKPNWPIPAFVPILFELTVLCAAVGMTVTFYLRNRFSIFKDPEIIHPRITDDRFAVVFDMDKLKGGDQNHLINILRASGTVEIIDREMKEKVLSADEQAA